MPRDRIVGTASLAVPKEPRVFLSGLVIVALAAIIRVQREAHFRTEGIAADQTDRRKENVIAQPFNMIAIHIAFAD